MLHFIVERSFSPPMTDHDLSEVTARMAPCLEMHDVRWIRSHLSEDRQRMVCEYEARDAETVRKVQHEAQANYDRVWAGRLIEP